MQSHLVISLDFELHWGIRDHTDARQARERLLGVWKAVPAMLSLFEERQIRATWAVVGMLMAESKDEILSLMPSNRPRYRQSHLDPYQELDKIGESERDDPLHYAPSLVVKIAATEGQEIGTHTFSHYYTMEEGQDLDMFAADMTAAIEIARRRGIAIRSIVFPRNQYTQSHLDLLPGFGIRSYRGASEGRIYRPARAGDESKPRRALRLVDSYLPLTGNNARLPRREARTPLVDVPSSRFLRPHTGRRLLDDLSLRRVTRGMSEAAERGRDYHLWWHPHNFGADLEENLGQLRRALDHFATLQRSHGMQSAHMSDRASSLLG